MKIIEGEFRVIEPEADRLRRHPGFRLARSLPSVVRWLLLHPVFWVLIGMIIFVGLTEGF